jgi:hypothetical protein
MTFVIEKNIPVTSGKMLAKYPFNDLEIGDSFLIPSSDDDVRDRRRASAAVQRQTHVIKRGKYVTRRVEGGIRIWRKA